MDVILRDLTKRYGDKRVFEGLSAVFPEGAVSCVMGPSGCGKTTLLHLLMGLETPDGGAVLGLEGKRRSAVFQEDRLCENLSPVANIRLVCPERGRARILEAMEAVGLSGCATQPVREFSGGMRRRVAILRALLAPYDVLFLDEPFKGLDADTKAAVMAYTARESAGKTVLLVTHDPSEGEALGAVQMLAL